MLTLNDRYVVVALCFLAAIRVFIYAAGFPVFNNVDEQFHFDLVVKYSHAAIPRDMELLSPESCQYIARYGSPEYFTAAQGFRSSAVEAANLANCQTQINHESAQAPLYYSLAAIWLRAGRILGVAGGFLPYWIRFLNIILAAALVWLGYLAAKQVFDDVPLVRLGVPLLLAVLPQDALFSIQNDVLSPICFGLAFLGLARWLQSAKPDARSSILTGLALAAVCLVKVSNLPLVAIGGLAVLLAAWRRRDRWPSLGLLLLSAGLPIACWIAWNLANFGDVTASTAKIQMLGWTPKPLSEWWPHPIFTPAGFWYFWSELLASFWRGEFVWDLKRLASSAVDGFTATSSAVLLATGILARPRRPGLLLASASFLASVAYLAILSVAFDFGDCFYPSRARPYFVSGRLMLGALIPFLLVYLCGLNRLAAAVKREKAGWWVLSAIAVLLLASQIVLDRVAFASTYNWFHLVAGASK